jgi:hypothetical protein
MATEYASSPEAQGMSSAVLADAFDYVREHRIPIHAVGADAAAMSRTAGVPDNAG